MKPWRECATDHERRAAVEDALRTSSGNRKMAAAALGISRQYLYAVMQEQGLAEAEVATPGAPATQAAAMVSLTLELPRACVEWLDLEAVKRKHRTGGSKAAKAPIVAELIEVAMREGRG